MVHMYLFIYVCRPIDWLIDSFIHSFIYSFLEEGGGGGAIYLIHPPKTYNHASPVYVSVPLEKIKEYAMFTWLLDVKITLLHIVWIPLLWIETLAELCSIYKKIQFS